MKQNTYNNIHICNVFIHMYDIYRTGYFIKKRLFHWESSTV